MQTKKILAGAVSATALVAILASAAPALANDGAGLTVGSDASLKTSVGTLKTDLNIKAKLETRAVDRASKEIDRRIKALNELSARVAAMKNVSATAKANIANEVNTEVSNLTALKAKIAADTDPAILKTDIKSITDSYRIFALIIPQGRILVSADRLNTVSDLTASLSAKLAARIADAQAAGKDVAALQASLNDLNAKNADAKVQSAAAVDAVASLTPDQGDKTKAEANRQALIAARAKINAGIHDLNTARQDAHQIEVALKKLGFKVNATSTVKAQREQEDH